MTHLIPFDYGDERIRLVTIDGEPWFVGADVARVLGYRMASDMTRRLDPEDKGTHSVRTPSGVQEMTVMTEAGLYDAVIGSHVPGAREFKRWVTHEVIPSIRKTGSYGTAAQIPQDYASALRELADTCEREQRQAAELAEANEHVAQLEPAAHSWETLVDTPGDYALRDAAQVLDRDPAVEIGEKRLARYLREIGWLDRKSTPYQRQVDAGRLVQRPNPYTHPHTGEQRQSTQVRITPKGLQELHKRLGGQRPLRLDVNPEAAA